MADTTDHAPESVSDSFFDTPGGDSGAAPDGGQVAASGDQATDTATPAETSGGDQLTSSAGQAGSPPSEGAPPPGFVPIAALKDERRKRQESDARIADLDRQIAFIQGQMSSQQPVQQQAQQPEPFDWTSPEADIERRIEARVNAVLSQRETNAFNARLASSVERARAKYEDYQDVENAFVQRARGTPLWARMQAAQDPAEFAYREEMRHRALGEIGDDPAEWRKRESERLKAELLAGLEQQRAAEAAGNSQLPRADGRSVSPPPPDAPLSDDTLLADVSAKW